MKRWSGIAALVIGIALMAIAVAGCGGGGLSASSSCKDFSEASPQEQTEVISSLSSKYNTPDNTSPSANQRLAITAPAVRTPPWKNFSSAPLKAEKPGAELRRKQAGKASGAGRESLTEP